MLLAFHNNPQIKSDTLARLRAHRAADEIIHGKYWENGKGCGVGCTIHSRNHLLYESELGIPVFLALLEDVLFECVRNEETKNFPIEFISSIKIGADLSLVSPKFALWIWSEEMPKTTENPSALRSFDRVADVFREWIATGRPDEEKLKSASAHASAYAYAHSSAHAYAYASADVYAYASASAHAYAYASAFVYAYVYAYVSVYGSAYASASASACFGTRARAKTLQLLSDCPAPKPANSMRVRRCQLIPA